MDNKNLIEVLLKVPEVKPLRIYRLAWDYVKADGTLDVHKVIAGVPELNEAAVEADEYMKAVRSLRSALECLSEASPQV